MSNTTSRLGLVQWIGTDAPTAYRTGNATNMGTLDNAAIYQEGTLAARPLASAVAHGTVYFATDASAYSISNGSAWTLIGNPSPVGSLAQYAGAADPIDTDGVGRWMICDGRAISRSTYATLFTAISTAFGTGNGSTTFNIPDGRGRVLAQVDGGAGRLHAQTLSGVANANTLAGAGGVDGSALSIGELPAHSHGITDPTHSHGTPYNIFIPGFFQAAGGPGDFVATTDLGAFNGTSAAATGITGTQSTGSGSQHNNAQPYLVVNHIIRVL